MYLNELKLRIAEYWLHMETYSHIFPVHNFNSPSFLHVIKSKTYFFLFVNRIFLLKFIKKNKKINTNKIQII